MQLNSVVLPEPFGPIRPQISPRPTEYDTPSSATTPPNRTATSRMDSSGSSLDLPAPWRSLASFVARRPDPKRFHRRPEASHLVARDRAPLPPCPLNQPTTSSSRDGNARRSGLFPCG